METVLTIAVLVGLAFWVIYTVDRNIVISGLRSDLEEYLSNAEKVVKIADDPRVTIHYRAVVTSVSLILSKYFPVRE